MKKKKKLISMREFKTSVWLWIMMIPGIAYLIVNNYIPLAGLQIAFKKYDYSVGMWKSPFVGFSNFSYLFKSGDGLMILRNTVLYNIVFIILGNLFAIIVSIILSELKANRTKNLYQVLILIPHLISMVMVSYLVYAFLARTNGFVNNTILSGLTKKPNFYTTPKYWPFILTFVHLWKGFGYSSIVYYATIVGIDSTLYEAAAVDGATKFERILHITLPCIRPTIITLMLLAIGRIMSSDFGLFFQVPMHSGLLYNVVTTIDVYVYNGVTGSGDLGRAAAAGFLQSIVGFIMVMAANMLVRKIDEESAFF